MPSHSHPKWTILGRLRRNLRRLYYDFVSRTFRTDDGRQIACKAVSGLRVRHPRELLGDASIATPYRDLGTPRETSRPSDRSDVVIITGRFRSGSTLLWNLFRRAGGFTAYYEPFNERRWFDPRVRGEATDPTHRNVSDYWLEYDGLEVLGQFYCEDWIRRRLLMDARSWDPDMKRYVDTLIDRAAGRPALQFNRIDFRLPWFRRHYPNAAYIHIYRHPRDQWCSTLRGDLKRFRKDASMAEFPPFDKFYLGMWAEDLKYHFPFLEETCNRHPYQMYYYIWKLSYLFGARYCDHSIAFEALLENPCEEIGRLFDAIGAETFDPSALGAVVAGPPVGKWREYADDAWFREHEAACEAVLADFLEPAGSVARPGGPKATAHRVASRWSAFPGATSLHVPDRAGPQAETLKIHDPR
jgi:hypothetical protein